MGDARETVEQFYALFASGDMAAATKLFDASCITLMPSGALSQSEHEAMGHAFKAGIPDAHMDIDHVVESGEEVVVLGHFRGKQSGDLHSPGGTIPASGRDLDLRFVDYFEVRDGKIVDHQTIFDQMEMLGQLGALPVA